MSSLVGAAGTHVYVRLLGEAVEVWKLVPAEPIGPDSVQLGSPHDDLDVEVLEFLPSQLVRCEHKQFADGQAGRAAVEQIERPGSRQPFLTCYDYGQGGIWVIVLAESATSIRTRYPELEIIPRVPDWMTPEVMKHLRERETYDLELEPTGFLAALVEQRTPQ